MGGSAVYQSNALPGKDDRVQRIRVAGAEDVHRLLALCLTVAGYSAHKG